MNNHQYYYRRTEKRYIIEKSSLAAVAEAAGGLTSEGRSGMIRIYYDTGDFALATEAVTGSGIQEALSIQSDGVPSDGSEVRLTLKKRSGEFTMENETAMTYSEARRILSAGNGAGRPVSGELGFDVDSLFGFYRDLSPRFAVSYGRKDFAAGISQHLTVSEITDPRIRMTHLDLGFGNAGDPMLEHDQVMLLLSSDRAIPAAVTKAIEKEGGIELRFSDLGCVYAGAVVSGSDRSGRTAGRTLRTA